MEITFRIFNGLAGDFHELLIAETDCGIKESMLFDRTFPFNLSFSTRDLVVLVFFTAILL